MLKVQPLPAVPEKQFAVRSEEVRSLQMSYFTGYCEPRTANCQLRTLFRSFGRVDIGGGLQTHLHRFDSCSDLHKVLHTALKRSQIFEIAEVVQLADTVHLKRI